MRPQGNCGHPEIVIVEGKTPWLPGRYGPSRSSMEVNLNICSCCAPWTKPPWAPSALPRWVFSSSSRRASLHWQLAQPSHCTNTMTELPRLPLSASRSAQLNVRPIQSVLASYSCRHTSWLDETATPDSIGRSDRTVQSRITTDPSPCFQRNST